MDSFLTGVAVGMAAMFAVAYIALHLAFRSRKEDRPLEVDPDEPPRYLVHIAADGEETTCTCHGRALDDGETFLYWPQPAKRLCRSTYGKVIPR